MFFLDERTKCLGKVKLRFLKEFSIVADPTFQDEFDYQKNNIVVAVVDSDSEIILNCWLRFQLRVILLSLFLVLMKLESLSPSSSPIQSNFHLRAWNFLLTNSVLEKCSLEQEEEKKFGKYDYFQIFFLLLVKLTKSKKTSHRRMEIEVGGFEEHRLHFEESA